MNIRPPDALSALSIAQASAALARHEISPRELTRAYLERSADHAHLGSYITISAELALEQAAQAEQELLRGERRGPLHGIPIALKDLIETAAVRTTAGTARLATNVPSADATVAARLKAAGAICLGKTNMTEWAMDTGSENAAYGACVNPWDTQRTAGGSSSGSAVAVAAHLCAGALGSDTAGSIRIPAAFCGAVGLKPTYGRISTHGVLPLSWNLDHVGPITRTVADAALLLSACAGYDAADPTAGQAAVDDYSAGLTAGVRGMRLAVLSDSYFRNAEPAVLQAFERAVAVLRAAGAVIEELAVDWGAQARRNNSVILVSDAATYHAQALAEQPTSYAPQTRADLERGAAYHATEYASARRYQQQLQRTALTIFERYRAVLLPTTPMVAHLRSDDGFDAVQGRSPLSFTAPFNFLGWPALSLPCGMADGLPVGLQIVGAPWDEATVLRVGSAYEQAARADR